MEREHFHITHQQKTPRTLQSKTDITPRANFTKDLNAFIQSCKDTNPNIIPIVMGDWNEQYFYEMMVLRDSVGGGPRFVWFKKHSGDNSESSPVNLKKHLTSPNSNRRLVSMKLKEDFTLSILT